MLIFSLGGEVLAGNFTFGMVTYEETKPCCRIWPITTRAVCGDIILAHLHISRWWYVQHVHTNGGTLDTEYFDEFAI